MNKRFFAAALTALLTLACHGNAHGHGGFGGGFHGGGFHGGGFHGGGAHFAAPRMAAPMYGGFHGGSVGGFRGAGPGFYHGPAYLGSSFHHGPSLNYSRGYAGMNSGAGRLGGYGGFNRAEMTHNLGGSSVFKCKTSRIGPSGPWPSGGCARSSSRSLATPDSSPGSIGPTDSSLTSVHRYAW